MKVIKVKTIETYFNGGGFGIEEKSYLVQNGLVVQNDDYKNLSIKKATLVNFANEYENEQKAKLFLNNSSHPTSIFRAVPVFG